jgi:hypothetical protein
VQRDRNVGVLTTDSDKLNRHFGGDVLREVLIEPAAELPTPVLVNQADENVFKFRSATISLLLGVGKVEVDTEPRFVTVAVTREYEHHGTVLYLTCRDHRMRTSLIGALIDSATNPQVRVDGEWQDEAWEDLFDAFPFA